MFYFDSSCCHVLFANFPLLGARWLLLPLILGVRVRHYALLVIAASFT